MNTLLLLVLIIILAIIICTGKIVMGGGVSAAAQIRLTKAKETITKDHADINGGWKVNWIIKYMVNRVKLIYENIESLTPCTYRRLHEILNPDELEGFYISRADNYKAGVIDDIRNDIVQLLPLIKDNPTHSDALFNWCAVTYIMGLVVVHPTPDNLIPAYDQVKTINIFDIQDKQEKINYIQIELFTGNVFIFPIRGARSLIQYVDQGKRAVAVNMTNINQAEVYELYTIKGPNKQYVLYYNGKTISEWSTTSVKVSFFSDADYSDAQAIYKEQELNVFRDKTDVLQECRAVFNKICTSNYSVINTHPDSDGLKLRKYWLNNIFLTLSNKLNSTVFGYRFLYMWVYLYTEEQMRDEYNNDKRYIWAIILMDYFTKNLNVSGVRALSEYQSIVKKIGSFSPYDETSDRFLNPMAVQYLKIMSNKPEYKYLEKIIEGVQNYKYVITQ